MISGCPLLCTAGQDIARVAFYHNFIQLSIWRWQQYDMTDMCYVTTENKIHNQGNIDCSISTG